MRTSNVSEKSRRWPLQRENHVKVVLMCLNKARGSLSNLPVAIKRVFSMATNVTDRNWSFIISKRRLSCIAFSQTRGGTQMSCGREKCSSTPFLSTTTELYSMNDCSQYLNAALVFASDHRRRHAPGICYRYDAKRFTNVSPTMSGILINLTAS
ncbi:hypothetical protein SCHPADRAFT_441467 [Schizopora paradoxa]|uniref:Uncharacterized protein n=1 Tax=Schizopora paradoxa TaxID=27342 RepID=A0A0H2S578_9AGAM|nr:hypothetical protein SCHPADRAFT_441467 [Schizopora paradoxa]